MATSDLRTHLTQARPGPKRTRPSAFDLKPFLPAFVLLVSDQALKLWVAATFPMLRRFEILGQDSLVLAQFHNRGLAFDRFSHIPNGYIEPYTLYFPALCLAAFVTMVALRWREAGQMERIFSGLLLAGGFSNLLDHFRQGYVVDTLQLSVLGSPYLPFNIADVGIVSGTAIVVALLLRDLLVTKPGRLRVHNVSSGTHAAQ